MSGTVEVWICDPRGNRVIPVSDFAWINIVKAVNGVGAFSIDLMSAKYRQYLLEDTIIEIDYFPQDGTAPVIFVGFIRKLLFYDGDGGSERVTATCWDQNYILAGRIVAYAAGSAQAEMTDQADDMLKEVVKDNLGSDAAAGRDLTALGLTVAGNKSAAPSITKAFAWKKLLETLQEIAAASAENGTRLYFDLAPALAAEAGLGFDFRTFIDQPGADRGEGSGNELIFGKERGNLDSPELEMDWSSEITYVYAGGQGEEADREIVEVEDALRKNASIWNRREAFADARNEVATAGVEAKGYAVLNAGRPKVKFSGILRDAPGSVFGVDWDLGTRVICEYQERSYNVIVTAAAIGIKEDGSKSVSGQFEVVES